MENVNLVVDFDSTFVRIESLGELAKIALRDKPGKERIVEEIERIMNLGMEGKLSFSESLQKRFELFRPEKKHVRELIKRLRNQVTLSVLQNRAFVRKYARQIYIISGAFDDWIVPVVREFGIRKSHVVANSLVYNSDDVITGYDVGNPLCRSTGKAKAIRNLGLSGEVWVIGDGYTDFEIKECGDASRFFVFTENVRRQEVVDLADYEVSDLGEFLRIAMSL